MNGLRREGSVKLLLVFLVVLVGVLCDPVEQARAKSNTSLITWLSSHSA